MAITIVKLGTAVRVDNWCGEIRRNEFLKRGGQSTGVIA
jgi:hypothetical protein